MGTEGKARSTGIPLDFPIWLAHGGTGSLDEMVIAAIGLAALIYFGVIWRSDRTSPREKPADLQPKDGDQTTEPQSEIID